MEQHEIHLKQTMIYKTLHRKLKMEQHEHPLKTNNDLQNITQKTKDGATRTPLKQTMIYCLFLVMFVLLHL
jgi:hypothetical protein